MKSTYLFRNLTRNPIRTVLTAAAVALPIMVYVLSTSVVDGIEGFLDNAARQLRLAVTHKSSIVNPLPAGHRAKIESLDPGRERLWSVCNMLFIGGRIPGNRIPLSTLAVDDDSFLKTFPEYKLSEMQAAAWARDRQALIVGSGTAAKLGWNIGDRVTIHPTFPPYTPMEFHIIATSEGTKDPVTNWCRLDYVNEELKKINAPTDLVSFIFVKCASKPDLDSFRTQIDALFERSPDETRTLDEKSFMNEFIAQQFDLPKNLTILSFVTVLVAVLAAANTMSMNFRDRLNEFATLKSLGFGAALVFSLIQTESLFVCFAGGLVGALGPYIVFTHTPVRDIVLPVIQQLPIDPFVCLKALGISLLIGLLAALQPSWLAIRLRVVDALRSLE